MYKQDSNKLVQTTRTTTITSHKTVTVDDNRNNVALYPRDSSLDSCLEEISNNIVHFYESRVDTGKGVGMTVNSVSSRFDWECGPILDEIWMTIGKIIFKYLINKNHHDKN